MAVTWVSRVSVYLAMALALTVPGAQSVQAQQGALEKAVASANVDAGARYALRCKACHTVDKGGANRLGPNLWGVTGRNQASARGYNYSPAFRKLTGAWSLDALDTFLADPRKFAPGNRMAFAGITNSKQRHDVLAYLGSLSDKQVQQTKPAAGQAGQEPSLADELGLAAGEGREDVAALCSACHSMAIVHQQALDRDRWDELMSWMTNTQGMPALLGEERKRVVDYLVEHFGPQARRSQPNAMNPMMPGMPAMPLPQPK